MSLEEFGGGDQQEVCVAGSNIDPEVMDPDDLVQWAADNYGIEFDEAQEKLTNAGVI